MAPTSELISTAPKRAAGFAVARHGVAVDDGRCRGRFARNAKEHGSDIAGRGGDRGHAEKEGKGFDRVHLENKRQHERHRGRSAEAGQDADDEADGDADHIKLKVDKLKTEGVRKSAR